MITLFGATGYTGRLVAAALAERALPFRLAGRSATQLQALSATLPGTPSWLVADVARPASLPALAEGTRVLVSCAGPFTDIGEPVAALAARTGLRYLDTTNELGYVHNVYSRLDTAARASGATLTPACAFEVALADCAAALVGSKLTTLSSAAEPAAQPVLDEASVIYGLPGMGSSYGTRASALRSLASSWLAYRDGRFVAARPASATLTFEMGGKARRALSFPSSETVTVPAHLNVRNVRTWMIVSSAASMYGPAMLWLGTPLLRGPLGGLLRQIAERAAPPPTPEQRARMPFTIQVNVYGKGQVATLTLRGFDPYGLTARIIAYAAARLLDDPAPPPGVQPPARILDPTAFLRAAREWGVEIDD